MKNNQCVHHDEVGSMCPTVLYFYLMLIQHHVIPWYPVKNTYSISALQTPTPTVLLGVKKKHSIVQNHIEMVWQNVITVCWVKAILNNNCRLVFVPLRSVVESSVSQPLLTHGTYFTLEKNTRHTT